MAESEDHMKDYKQGHRFQGYHPQGFKWRHHSICGNVERVDSLLPPLYGFVTLNSSLQA